MTSLPFIKYRYPYCGEDMTSFPSFKYRYPYCGEDMTSFPFIKYRYPHCGEEKTSSSEAHDKSDLGQLWASDVMPSQSRIRFYEEGPLSKLY